MADQPLPSLLYLWDKRTLYIGPLFEPLSLSQGAATLVVSLDKPMTFSIEGKAENIECTSLLLPAGLSATIDTGDAIVANCNLDPLGADFSGLSALMQHQHGKIGYDLKPYGDFKQVYQTLQAEQLDSDSAYELLDDLLEKRFSQLYPNHAIDSRVAKVVERIKQTADDNLSVDDLASFVNLSVPRLVQIFKKQTGVPMRRYRLWHRLFITAVEMASGGNLTEAAMNAGFTDSAHFSHTFKAMFGMAPTTILMQPNSLKIVIQNQ
ncbi:MAG: helix-turn-helix transcriptional regulator [Oleispira sp.]|nr:helix-turn-helix transcriptional regulator [Oleispira sp.]MBL4881603.1 helix-turn-helix transcriptional regulator [Oleispira sp.]